jgi:branched-chain amino acid transport system substrate-binding protein
MFRGVVLKSLVVAFFVLLGISFAHAGGETAPVLVGFDGEFGHKTSTSAEAIKRGILCAIDEINERGGVLGGRKLALKERDNRSVPARGVENLREFATLEDLVAVFTGKFSPVVIDQIPLAHDLKMPLLDPWAAADAIVDNGYTPNFVFRLSLRDEWAMAALLRNAKERGFTNVGMLVPNTAWGRSSIEAAQRIEMSLKPMQIVATNWYNWGDTSLAKQYHELRVAGSEAIILVANEGEGSILVKEVAALPEEHRLPIFSHWGVSGGDFVALSGPALERVDFSVVYTFTFLGQTSAKRAAVLERARRLFGIASSSDIKSQVGFAHAYDLTHILAQAIDKAGTTDRSAIRDALERLGRYEGLVRVYDPPFTAERHEALSPEEVLVGRFTTNGIKPVGR